MIFRNIYVSVIHQNIDQGHFSDKVSNRIIFQCLSNRVSSIMGAHPVTVWYFVATGAGGEHVE